MSDLLDLCSVVQVLTVSHCRLFSILRRLVTDDEALDMERMHTVVHRHVLSSMSNVCRTAVSYCLFSIHLIMFRCGFTKLFCLPCSRQHLRYDCCLEDKREDCQNCSVLHCVQQLCTVICTHIRAVVKVTVGLDVAFLDSGFLFVSSPFVPVLFPFVVLDLVSSVPSQEIGYEERLPNDIFCVKWNVKPYLSQLILNFDYCYCGC